MQSNTIDIFSSVFNERLPFTIEYSELGKVAVRVFVHGKEHVLTATQQQVAIVLNQLKQQSNNALECVIYGPTNFGFSINFDSDKNTIQLLTVDYESHLSGREFIQQNRLTPSKRSRFHLAGCAEQKKISAGSNKLPINIEAGLQLEFAPKTAADQTEDAMTCQNINDKPAVYPANQLINRLNEESTSKGDQNEAINIESTPANLSPSISIVKLLFFFIFFVFCINLAGTRDEVEDKLVEFVRASYRATTSYLIYPEVLFWLAVLALSAALFYFSCQIYLLFKRPKEKDRLEAIAKGIVAELVKEEDNPLMNRLTSIIQEQNNELFRRLTTDPPRQNDPPSN